MSTGTSLPDPETTDAESVTVPDEDVLSEIPDDNPFRETIVGLRDEGADWSDVHSALETAYGPVDRATYEESFVEMPVYEVSVVVPDEHSTSGEAYETRTVAEATPEAARERATEQSEVRRVEHVEQIGTKLVG